RELFQIVDGGGDAGQTDADAEGRMLVGHGRCQDSEARCNSFWKRSKTLLPFFAMTAAKAAYVACIWASTVSALILRAARLKSFNCAGECCRVWFRLRPHSTAASAAKSARLTAPRSVFRRFRA